MYRLSICIPTYNRGEYFRETLDSILAQGHDDVEVVVGDDASPDGTADLMASYVASHKNVVYYRNDTNRGMDYNFVEVVRRASGEYCWLMGDDDVLEPGAIDVVLNEYLAGVDKPDFLVASYRIYDQPLANVLSSSNKELGIEQDVTFCGANEAFTNLLREVCLSAYIVRRDRWMTVDGSRYEGTMYAQVGAVYEALPADARVTVIGRPLVKYRAGNASWTRKTITLLSTNVERLLAALPDRYDPVKHAARDGFRQRFPITLGLLARLRANRIYGSGDYVTHLHAYFEDYPAKRAAAWLIARMPPAFFMLLLVITKRA
ncbi:MAG TPA: glycosyltransferase family 2 protein [Capsulimonadaceae bacterium]|jgi:glycosyltransferase involved in cell wall biosynthesis